MNRAATATPRRESPGPWAALLLAVVLAGCGAEPRAPAVTEPGPRGTGSASTATDPGAARYDFLPPKLPRVVEETVPSVQACIEQNIHGKAYDSLAPRDARRKLRRLQVKAECEERLAAR